jgi:hypothetical protein
MTASEDSLFFFLLWQTLLPVLDNHTTAFSPCLFPPKGALNQDVLYTVRPLFRLLFFAKGVAFRAPLVLIVHRAADGFVERIKPWLTADGPFWPPSSERVCLFVIPFENTRKIG